MSNPVAHPVLIYFDPTNDIFFVWNVGGDLLAVLRTYDEVAEVLETHNYWQVAPNSVLASIIRQNLKDKHSIKDNELL